MDGFVAPKSKPNDFDPLDSKRAQLRRTALLAEGEHPVEAAIEPTAIEVADPGALPARHWLQAWTAMLIPIDPAGGVRGGGAGVGGGVTTLE